MMKVANGKCVRRLAVRGLRSSRTRNAIAILAIALTSVLFTSLFTIAMTMNSSYQDSNFRQAGGWNHGTFKYLTQAQFETLRDDPMIREWGLRRFLGMPTDPPFHKNHVEIGYSDAVQAHYMFCDVQEGRLPQEGTDEAATDTKVLELLGIEPKLGAKFSVTFPVDGHETTQEFTLCGWWPYDEAINVSMILIPESRVNAVLAETGVTPPGSEGIVGTWNLDILLDDAWSIEADMQKILANHGFQSEGVSETGDYIQTGVNWGYTAAQMFDTVDTATVLLIGVMLVLILLTGYLIIYNVFQISVANDIRYYGLLKTIGTTGRQLRRIIRHQALTLSLAGIPLGLLGGYGVGRLLAPVVVRQMSGIHGVVYSASPLIFVFAAVFSLATVLVSCARPGRMAARVSPIEALRYTEQSGRKKKKRSAGRVAPFSMAVGNLGRSRKKTAVTLASLCLALCLLELTALITGGFDMDQYLARMASDFLVGDARQLQTGGEAFNRDLALPEAAIEAVEAQGGITAGGRVYGATTVTQEFVTEEFFRAARVNSIYSPEAVEAMMDYRERLPDGLLADYAQLYGMEAFALDKLTVVAGDLSRLYEPGARCVAAVYRADDYQKPEPQSHWAKAGDTITLRHVERMEYYAPDTGEVYEGNFSEDRPLCSRAAAYHDVEYEVVAEVMVPSSLNYGFYGTEEFVLGAETFRQDTGSGCVMYYAFDVEDAAEAEMEAFLADYTENQNGQLDYESKGTYAQQFAGLRGMFAVLGGALSLIVGLVGILNFFNAVLTSIVTRRREFAMLQSVGMTGRQLRRMLVWEGLLYALLSAGAALVLSALFQLLLGPAMEEMFWFFTLRFTFTPILICIPILAAIAVAVQSLCYRRMVRRSVVERLREAE